MSSETPTLGFIGIGLMGRPMTERLLDAGYPMVLWNRTRSKAEALADRASIVDTVAELAQQADILITMLENGQVVDEVLMADDVLRALRPGQLVIDMSSVQPALARRHQAMLARRGVDYLDAPVSGGTVGAAQATLSIMAGGEAEDLERARPVLETLGRVTHIGPVGSGQLAKLANQAIVGITIGAVSEALLLAAQGGANPAAVREALMGGFAGSRILDLHGERMLKRRFEPGAPARIQLKDMQMILEEAAQCGLSLPLAQQTLSSYQQLVAAGHGDVDHSGLLLHLEALNDASLDPERSAEH